MEVEEEGSRLQYIANSVIIFMDSTPEDIHHLGLRVRSRFPCIKGDAVASASKRWRYCGSAVSRPAPAGT